MATSFITILLIILVTFSGSRAELKLIRFEFSQTHMGTRFNIILYARDAVTATSASTAAFKCVEELDAIMSDYRATSELMLLCNKPAGRWVRVSGHLFRVLTESQRLARETDGAFDVTVAPVVRLWRRARRTGQLPDELSLVKAKELIGYQKLELNQKTTSVRLAKHGMLLDLGGIAKGYAADEAIAVLKRHGISQALVAAGGDIVVSGPPPGTRGWIVGIARVARGDDPPEDCLLLSDAAVSTSGYSEQSIEIGGVRYSHIVDPRTGLGLSTDISATVIAGSGIKSDSLATAASALGPQRGLKLIESVKGASGIIRLVTQEGFQSFSSNAPESRKPFVCPKRK